MSTIHQSEPNTDLAARAFHNFYFAVGWLLFLTFVLRLVQPLQDALLVFWVYGRHAYFQQGIRVVKHKPTIFSNGMASPDLPNMVTGFGTFLVIVFGLSWLLVSALHLYERHFGGRVQEVARRLRLLPIIRDVVIILVLLELGPMLLAMATHSPQHEAPHYTTADAVVALLLGIVGFTLSGYFATSRRWHHLGSVAFGVWLFCFLKGAFIGGRVLTGIVIAIILAVLMGIGGALSYVFKRKLTESV